MGSCDCVSCGECNGSGRIRVKCEGFPEYEVVTCPDCRGTGVSEQCEICEEEDDGW